ncbi:13022_t:CDS:1, partial [Dentiscutata erythropus]
MCDSILASLNKRWEIPNKLGCIASFLDSRFKYLTFLMASQIENVKYSLKRQIELFESPSQSCLVSSTTTTSNHSVFINYFNQNLSLQYTTSLIDLEIS